MIVIYLISILIILKSEKSNRGEMKMEIVLLFFTSLYIENFRYTDDLILAHFVLANCLR